MYLERHVMAPCGPRARRSLALGKRHLNRRVTGFLLCNRVSMCRWEKETDIAAFQDAIQRFKESRWVRVRHTGVMQLYTARCLGPFNQ